AMGAWTIYGLGSLNENLPAFVVLTDQGEVNGGPKNWSSGFLPAIYQGTHFRPEGAPILHLAPPEGVSSSQQRNKLDLLARLNERFSADKSEDSELNARINSYELAWRMQSAAPEVTDLSRESEATKRLYGLDSKTTEKFGRNLLLARRLVERGVRFVQCYSGSGNLWDAHSDLEGNHAKYCGQTDRPIAGLLTDLKARGLLEST